MDVKKKRSSLYKSVPGDTTTPQLKRRISFRGKNSVREFHNEEEPKTWNNSYEISDHLNVDETSSSSSVSKNKSLRDDQKEVVSPNTSDLLATKDFINLTYGNSNLHIENSVDITLYKKEINSFSFDANEKIHRSNADNEKTIDIICELNKNKVDNVVGGVIVSSEHLEEVQGTYLPCPENIIAMEPVAIYMNDSMSMSLNEENNTSKQLDEKKKSFQRSNAMELFTPTRANQYDKENIIPTSVSDASHHMDMDYNFFGPPRTKVNVDKESQEFEQKLNRLSLRQESEMDVSQQTTANVNRGGIPKEKSSRATNNFNQPIEVSFVKSKPASKGQMSDNNYMQMEISQTIENSNHIAISNKLLRSTINFNQPIEFSPSKAKTNTNKQNAIFKKDISQITPLESNSANQTLNRGAIPKQKSRPSIYFNQSIDVSPDKGKTSSNRQTLNLNEDICQVSFGKSNPPRRTINFVDDMRKESPVSESISSNQTIHFNEDLRMSPIKSSQDTTVSQHQLHIPGSMRKPRPTTNFNTSIDVSPDKGKTSSNRQTVSLNEDIPQVSSDKSNPSRQTVNFIDDDMRKESPAAKSISSKQTINFNEDLHISPTSQDITIGQHLNLSESTRKNVVVRKICIPLESNSKKRIDLDQQRMLRLKNKLEQGTISNVDASKKKTDTPQKLDVSPKVEKSFNMTLNSVKDLSLSSESSSPLIPSEFKGLNLKQLNDEIERGAIQVYLNVPKTPTTDRKKSISYFSKNLNCPDHSKSKTILFKDADNQIPTADDTLTNAFTSLKSNDYLGFNVNEEKAIENNTKRNAKCRRYSQADDMMLDKTSFLTRAKLGDETASRNSSKRDVTQMNYSDIQFDETLKELTNHIKVTDDSAVKNIKGVNANKEFEKSVNEVCYNSQQPERKHSRQTMHFDNESIENNVNSDSSIFVQVQSEKENRQTLHMNEEIELEGNQDDKQAVDKLETHSARMETIVFYNDLGVKAKNNSVLPANGELYVNRDIETYMSFDHTNIQKSNYNIHYDDEKIQNEESHQEEIQYINATTPIKDAEKAKPQTLYLSEDIEHEFFNDLNPDNMENTNIQEPTSGSKQTMLFNNYEFESSMLEIKETADKLVKYRPTSNFNQEMDLDESFEKSKYVSNEAYSNTNSKNEDKLCNKVSQSRKSIHVAQCMDLTLDETKNQSNNRKELDLDQETENSKHSFHESNSNKPTHTNSENNDRVSQSRKSIHVAQCMNLILDETKNYSNNQNVIDNFGESTDKVSQSRRSIHVVQSMDIPIDENKYQSNHGKETDLDQSFPKSEYVSNDAYSNINSKNEEKLCNKVSQSRKSIHVAQCMDLTLGETENQTNNQKETDLGQEIEKSKLAFFESNSNNDKVSQSRKSIHADECMDVTLDETTNHSNNQNDIESEHNDKVSQSRKSIHVAQCMDLTLDETKNHSNNQNYIDSEHNDKVSQSRKSIYVAQCMDLTLDEAKNHSNNQKEADAEQSMEKPKHAFIESCSSRTSNINSKNNNKVSESRKSEHVAECMDITLDETTIPPKESCVRKSLYTGQCMDITLNTIQSNVNEQVEENASELMMDQRNIVNEFSMMANNITNIAKISNLSSEKIKNLLFEKNNDAAVPENIENEESKLFLERKTLYFDNKNDISTEKNILSDEFTTKSLNSAKISLIRKNNMELIKQNCLPITPKSIKQRRSVDEDDAGLTEFEAFEKKTLATPLRKKTSVKRLPFNLTPVLSMAKKKQTKVLDNCNMDETKNKSMNIIEHFKPNECNIYSTTRVMENDNPMDISGIISNESVMLKRSMKQEKLQTITTNLCDEKESNKSLNQARSSCSKDVGREELAVEMDGDHLFSESVEVLRRATTFQQRPDTITEPHHNNEDTKLDYKHLTSGATAAQLSIFEGNPITISDVSVFFTAQRQSNECIDINSPCPNLAVADVTVPVLPDKDANQMCSFQNRYINITCDSPLEDIDKTHVSLVRTLSDDDEENDDEHENDFVIVYNDPIPAVSSETQKVIEAGATGGVTNVTTTADNVRHNVRNSSVVCRKCKRCQNTFLNETTSSTAESFIMPEVQPLPDLGLDRLRRLRKRPTISDVHILWQRVSLDRTIVNPINISDDGTQALSDTEDEHGVDESDPGIKALRKFEKEMKEFEMELLASVPEKIALLKNKRRSFVIRLEELLRNNAPNWIFDYQMQIRGIYLFGHRQMYTFSVALKFVEIDPLGIDINLESVQLQKGVAMPEKNWKPIDFALDFQLKLNLPFDLQSLCKGIYTEASIFEMLQTIDHVCVETVRMGNDLQKVVFRNLSSVIRDGCRTFVRKNVRKLVNGKVEKTEVRVELLNIKKLSFKDIVKPPLHYFREEIHLLPVGIQFLQEFLPDPLKFLKESF